MKNKTFKIGDKVYWDGSERTIYRESITPKITIWIRRGTDIENDIALSRSGILEVFLKDLTIKQNK